MNRGILLASITALAMNGLFQGCRTPADPAQLRTVDSLITTVDAAMLTLNELDRTRYQRTDSMFQVQRPLFEARFKDTLDRAAADVLGNQFLALRTAADMGRDHERVLNDLGTTAERLRALRLDLQNGAMEPPKGRIAMNRERTAWSLLETSVLGVIDNYRIVQRTWENVAQVDTLLTPKPMMP
ncbi:MAG: hypothetical protein ABI432_06825 [Flavobacteriales bacterium]